MMGNKQSDSNHYFKNKKTINKFAFINYLAIFDFKGPITPKFHYNRPKQKAQKSYSDQQGYHSYR